MPEVYNDTWVSFDDIHEDVGIKVSFSGMLSKYPHEGMNGTTVTLCDIEDLKCVALKIEGGEIGSVKDYYKVFGREVVDNLISRAEEKAWVFSR